MIGKTDATNTVPEIGLFQKKEPLFEGESKYTVFQTPIVNNG